MLSASEQWSAVDEDFDMENFYNIIVKVFEHDPEDEWVLETLAFWNK